MAFRERLLAFPLAIIVSAGIGANVLPSPAIIVVSPNGGEEWVPGNTCTISWRFAGIRAEEVRWVDIYLLKDGSVYHEIAHHASPGTGISGSFDWNLPLFFAYGSVFRVRLEAETERTSASDPFHHLIISDESNGNFVIRTSGRLAFVSAEPGSASTDISLLDENGRRQLTHGPWNDLAPTWSPDWKRIAFASNRDRGNIDVYVMNADGTHQERITRHPAEDNDPAWSPDGRKIAFTSIRDGNAEIYVVNVNGTELIRLTYHPGEDKFPAWSPDGTKIAFTSSRDGDYEIYVVNADGTDPRRLTFSRGADFDPAWSPDGRRIAFASKRDGNFEIYAMDADGTHQVRLTYSPTDERCPTWSFDGNKIAFSSNARGRFEIYVMDADGRNTTVIVESVPGSLAYDPAWTPRGLLLPFPRPFPLPRVRRP